MLPTGQIPSTRSNHTMIQYENKLIVFGGFGEIVYSKNDLWLYNIERNNWLMVEDISIKQK